MTINQLENIYNKLKAAEEYGSEQLLQDCIHERLTINVAAYDNSLVKTAKKLEVNNGVRVLKAYTKMQRNADKEAMKAAAKEQKEQEKDNA